MSGVLAAVVGWISQQDATAVVIGCGVLAASLVAIIGLFRQPVVMRPIRWFGGKIGIIGRVLVGDPLTKVIHRALDEWAAKVWEPRIDGIEAKVDEVHAQFLNNGGSTAMDQLDAIGSAVGAKPRPKVGPPPDDAE